MREAQYLRKTGKTAGSAGDAAISMKVKLRLRNVLHAIMSRILSRLNAKNIKGGLMISKILVPTDGSKAAQKAGRHAVDLAKQLKASVIVLSVMDQRSFTGQTIPAAQTAMHVIEPIEDYLRGAAEGYAGEIKKLCEKTVSNQRRS